jgi:hypothetical protein
MLDVSRVNWLSKDLIEVLPAAVYVCDSSGVVVAFNKRATELWGRAPCAGDTDEKFCGAYKLFHPDGRYLPHNETRWNACCGRASPRGVFGTIKRELRRRSAIEPLIGHMKQEGHLGRCYLKGHAGDAANAILTAAGYNFRRILAWLSILLRLILSLLMVTRAGQKTLQPAS